MVKKHDESLFRIGEAAKILGVTRKAILGYEEMGLLTPAVRDEESGCRCYTADNMTQIRSIRSLQSPGLSLKEAAELLRYEKYEQAFAAAHGTAGHAG